jgi:PhnB protein
MSDPFTVFTGGDEPVQPRPDFAAELRSRIALLLNTPTIDMTPPSRSLPMPTTRVTPYLTVHAGAEALAFYATAFGAVEAMRVVMDEATGQLGHAEFTIGTAVFYLSDEFPEMGVVSPRTLGGTAVAMHIEIDDVDTTFANAVAAGATSLSDPADQPHGARHGTLIDPFGHRWMLSQQIEQVDLAEYGDRMREQGATVSASTSTPVPTSGGIWAALNFADAQAGIRYMIDVFGFEADLIVPGEDPTVVEHSQLRWPEGGVVQAATANRPGNPYSERPIGTESLYVITTDPGAVYERCLAVGAEIIAPPMSPDYDPNGSVFSMRDPEGNIWSFGTYAG